MPANGTVQLFWKWMLLSHTSLAVPECWSHVFNRELTWLQLLVKTARKVSGDSKNDKAINYKIRDFKLTAAATASYSWMFYVDWMFTVFLSNRNELRLRSYGTEII